MKEQPMTGTRGKVILQAASLVPPLGLQELIDDLGMGENGFGGTPVHRGEMTMGQYLEQCRDRTDPDIVPPGYVPETVFWIMDEDGLAVGILRMRHCLNDKLRFDGGHIGYFIRHGQRGKGYGKEALRLALIELRKMGVTSALLTVDSDNIPSIRTIEGNGGRYDSVAIDPKTSKEFKRYWIELGP
jgi:predicted acetyltransferase